MRKLLFFSILVGATSATTANALSLRSARQLQAHYSTATDVPSSRYNIRIVAREAVAALPVSSDVEGYQGSVVKAASKLAAAYCFEFVYDESEKPAATRRAHSAIDFTAGPASITPEALSSTMAAYAGLFWGRAPRASELGLLDNLAMAARREASNDARGTVDALAAICSAVAVSLDSLIIQD